MIINGEMVMCLLQRDQQAITAAGRRIDIPLKDFEPGYAFRVLSGNRVIFHGQAWANPRQVLEFFQLDHDDMTLYIQVWLDNWTVID